LLILLSVPFCFSLSCPRAPPALPSFPTRRSSDLRECEARRARRARARLAAEGTPPGANPRMAALSARRRLHPPMDVERQAPPRRSEEHTSELQSRVDLVCRLLLEKKKKNTQHSKE